MTEIYLDNNASTPVDPRVADVVFETMKGVVGNANSTEHRAGEQATRLIAQARSHVARLVGADADHVVFTHGATHAIHLAVQKVVVGVIQGRRRPDARNAEVLVASSTVEHRALLGELAQLERSGVARIRWVDVDSDGSIRSEELNRACAGGVDMICLMAANNEIGAIYPTASAITTAQSYGATAIIDATQAFGKIAVDIPDWASTYVPVSAHKIYGPPGVGALISAKLRGAAADEERSFGTPNVPGIVGFGEAARLRLEERREDEQRIAGLRDRMMTLLCAAVPDLVINGPRERRLSGNLHVSAPGAANDAVLARLRGRVAISTGSACVSGTDSPSHVLTAMRLPGPIVDGALRIGIGKFNTADEIDAAAACIAQAINDVRYATLP
jgi:cysteine desulfurase